MAASARPFRPKDVSKQAMIQGLSLSPNGETLESAFYEVNYDFVLQKAAIAKAA